MTEKTIDQQLREDVKTLGGWSLKLSAAHVAGLPDRLVLLPGGRVIFVEVKGPGEKPRKLQLIRHNQLRALGFPVFVLDHTNQIKKILE